MDVYTITHFGVIVCRIITVIVDILFHFTPSAFSFVALRFGIETAVPNTRGDKR
jgi:hypothetical protein